MGIRTGPIEAANVRSQNAWKIIVNVSKGAGDAVKSVVVLIAKTHIVDQINQWFKGHQY